MTKSAQPGKVKEEQAAPEGEKKTEEKSSDISNKAKARELILKARIYRFFGLVFAGAGIILFSYAYSQRANGEFLVALKDPTFVLFFILPFMPSIVLSSMASRAEKKVHDFLKEP